MKITAKDPINASVIVEVEGDGWFDDLAEDGKSMKYNLGPYVVTLGPKEIENIARYHALFTQKRENEA
jgi:hypothetical protein